MKKILFLATFLVASLFSMDLSGLSNPSQVSNMMQKYNLNNNDVKQYINSIEKNGVHNPGEYIMLGITYEYGIEKAGIKQDKNKAKFYYKKAHESKITYGTIKYAIILLNEGKIKKADKMLMDLYFSDRKSDTEAKIIIALKKETSKFLKKNDEYLFFLTEGAEKYHNDDDALELFFVKLNGTNGVEKDVKEAEKYLNIACKNIKHKEVFEFCKNSNMIVRIKNKD